jgi:hypothetical protein
MDFKLKITKEILSQMEAVSEKRENDYFKTIKENEFASRAFRRNRGN